MSERTLEPLQQLARMVALVWAASPIYSVTILMLTGVAALVPAAQVYLFKLVLDSVAMGLSGSGVRLWTLMAGIAVVWVANLAIDSVAIHLRMLLGMRVEFALDERLLQKAAGLDLAQFDTPEFHDQLENARSMKRRAHDFVLQMLDAAESGVRLCSMLVLLIEVHWLISVVLVATSVPHVVALMHYSDRRHDLWRDRTRERRMAGYLGDLLCSRAGAQEVRVFRLQDHLLARFRACCERFLSDELRSRLAFTKVSLATGLLSLCGTLGVWIYMVADPSARARGVGDIALVLQAAERGRDALSSLFRRIGQMYEHSRFAECVFGLLDHPVVTDRGRASGSSLPGPRSMRAPEIVFRDISFAYPQSDRAVLKHVSFVLSAGTTTAVVGPNGAGKSTLVKLLCRLYEPTEGSIIVDGCELAVVDPEYWRSLVSVVFQDYVKYQFTLRENVIIGDVERPLGECAVQRALDAAGAGRLIGSLPHGMETALGRAFGDGVDLSEGEWQKVATARGYARDRCVIVMDEPTASLDPFAEEQLLTRMRELSRGRTSVIISHRFSTIRSADQILVLEGGRIVEAGRHADLMQRGSLYAKMFMAQARQYG